MDIVMRVRVQVIDTSISWTPGSICPQMTLEVFSYDRSLTLGRYRALVGRLYSGPGTML